MSERPLIIEERGRDTLVDSELLSELQARVDCLQEYISDLERAADEGPSREEAARLQAMEFAVRHSTGRNTIASEVVSAADEFYRYLMSDKPSD
ncbi:MAG TPA: hypothetical protein VN838_28680 [Bradyrhizobium sp.]|nr:hypothetical protein [Bradyrhizobium sp.]